MVAENASALWLFVIPLVYATLTLAEPSEKNFERTVGDCASPYTPVGPDNYCLFIDNRIEGTWDQMRSFCKQLQGDLAFFKDANLLYDAVHYIHLHGLNDSSFWIGSQDLLEEDHWVWAWDNTDVRRNTPLWGTTRGSQEPLGSTAENCGKLNRDLHYFMDDCDCGSLAGVICDPLTNQQKGHQKVSGKENKQKDPSAGCPPPFQLIEDSCLLIDSIPTNTWENGELLCTGLGGHLAKIENANILGDLFDMLKNQSISMDFWIGGSDVFEENSWVWQDNSPVKMDTPFWGLTYLGEQEPTGGVNENCLALSVDDFYYFNDLPCENTGGVICQYDL